jgi:hypothetical protein
MVLPPLQIAEEMESYFFAGMSISRRPGDYTMEEEPIDDGRRACSGARSFETPAPKPEGGKTMRFMLLMIPKGYEKAAPGAVPDAEAVAAMMKYNESLQKAGVLLGLEGLHPPSAGARVAFSGGKPTVTDGPFIETRETIGGYWMIQVNSKAEAVEWASRCPASDKEVIEVRQVQELADFPADVQAIASGFSEMRSDPNQRKER